jgi:DNA-directed RNA polymerase specialized sigma24 family protein
MAVKLDGKSYVEIAAEVGKTPDAIRMRVNRALEALTRIFKELEAGD